MTTGVTSWNMPPAPPASRYLLNMSYPEPPDSSKTQIRKAGKKLASSSSSPTEIESAQLLVDQFRAAHQWPMLTARVTLSGRAKRISDEALVVQRLKRMPSILGKLQSGRVKDVSTMQDLGGCRAIMPSIDDVHELAEKYMGTTRNNVFDFTLRNDYIANPKPNGYRGLHFVGTYSSDKREEFEGYSVELQLRTKLMHSWATSVEIVDTFEQSGLKSSKPDEFNNDWDYFFAYAGAAIALIEGTPVPHGMPETETGVRKGLADLDAGRLVQRVSDWSSSMRHITKLGGRGQYFLLSVDADRRAIEIKRFRNSAEAEEAYRDLEADSRSDSVLVGGKSMEEIQKAYPNYFADTKRFSALLRSLLK